MLPECVSSKHNASTSLQFHCTYSCLSQILVSQCTLCEAPKIFYQQPIVNTFRYPFNACTYVHMHGATCVRTTSHGAATDILKFKLRQIRSNIRSDKLCSAFSFISYNHNLICQSESKLNRNSFDIVREQLSSPLLPEVKVKLSISKQLRSKLPS